MRGAPGGSQTMPRVHGRSSESTGEARFRSGPATPK